MDQRRRNYLHAACLDHGQWLRDGRASTGMYQTLQWPSGKPPKPAGSHIQRRKGKSGTWVLPCKENRPQGRSRPLLHRIDNRAEAIHPVVMEFPESILHLYCLLYLHRLPMLEARRVLALSSRQANDAWYGILQAIDSAI